MASTVHVDGQLASVISAKGVAVRLTCLTPGFPHEPPIRERPRRVWPFLLLVAALLFASGMGFGAESSGIQNVSISRPFFNPSLGQRIGISFSVDRPGSLTVLILDRDGFLVRQLVSKKSVEKGPLSFDWDGRGDSREIVPDEAYSLKIDLSAGGQTETYFPGNAPGERLTAKTNYYDRFGRILSYTLPRAARVHIQVGTGSADPKTGKPQGQGGRVLKTLVNREPRTGGSVVESWNGNDESGSVYIPNLPDFVVAIAATALPENAILSTGNRTRNFVEHVGERSGGSLLTFSVHDHHHHQGLATLDDVAPTMRLKPLNADWSSGERAWVVREKSLDLAVSLEGPSAISFARQPGRLWVFLDEKTVRQTRAPSSGVDVSIPLASLSAGVHLVAVNWASDYGPATVNTVSIRMPDSTLGSASGKSLKGPAR